MTDINRYNQIKEVVSSTLFAVWDNINGVAGNASAQQIKEFISETVTSGISQQYASPSATGFSVSLQDASNTWLIITPLAGYAAGTLVLPSTPANLYEFTVSTTQAVTALTVNGNGKSVVGAPTTLTAGSAFSMRYDSINQTWYRI